MFRKQTKTKIQELQCVDKLCDSHLKKCIECGSICAEQFGETPACHVRLQVSWKRQLLALLVQCIINEELSGSLETLTVGLKCVTTAGNKQLSVTSNRTQSVCLQFTSKSISSDEAAAFDLYQNMQMVCCLYTNYSNTIKLKFFKILLPILKYYEIINY